MARLGTKALLKSNVEFWLNDTFLREGLYVNVASGELDFYGNNISLFSPIVGDPSFADGCVFQSPYRNWVYESGILPITSGVVPPIVASGVAVNGTFYPEDTTTGTYEHFLDFTNGRAIFISPLAGPPIVEGAFAYKEVNVESASKLNNENTTLLIETALKDNPPQTGVQRYPETLNRTLPCVWFDFQKRTSLPYELGTRNPIKEYTGVFHIWAHDEFMLDTLEDILADRQREVIFGANYNTAEFPLLIHGQRNPAWPGYAAQTGLYGADFWRRIYLDVADPRQVKPLMEIERSEVAFTIRVYPNF